MQKNKAHIKHTSPTRYRNNLNCYQPKKLSAIITCICVHPGQKLSEARQPNTETKAIQQYPETTATQP